MKAARRVLYAGILLNIPRCSELSSLWLATSDNTHNSNIEKSQYVTKATELHLKHLSPSARDLSKMEQAIASKEYFFLFVK